VFDLEWIHKSADTKLKSPLCIS